MRLDLYRKTKDKNIGINYAEYQRGAVVLRSLPRYILMELTQECNLQCEMCRGPRNGVTPSRMDDTLFRRVADELFPTAELVDLRGWGESLLLPNIVELIRYTCNLGCNVRFVTNLSFRRERVLEALAEHHCYVAVSLDSAEEKILQDLRQGASLTRIQRNLQFLVKQYLTLYGNTNRIVIYCTVQQPALATLDSLITFASEVGVHEVRIATVITKKPHLSLSGCDESVERALKSVEIAAQRHGIRVVIATHFAGLPECKSNKRACIRPWSFACINVGGYVTFCDHLIGPSAQKYIIGDLRTNSFQEIWNSESWQELRREHWIDRRAGAPLFLHCDWCYRKRFVEFEDQFFPDLATSKVILPANLGGGYAY